MASESFLSKNLFSIIPILLSMFTAVASSWAMQARLDERMNRTEQDMREVKEEMKGKVAKEELQELKQTLNEMKSDIKKLLLSRKED